MWDRPLAVKVEAYGLQWVFGPIPTLPAAMKFVSDHVWDTDTYRHEYLSLIDPAEGAAHLNRRVREGAPGRFGVARREAREPLEVVLRAAIAREHGEAGDGPYGDGLLAHLDVHRPWRVRLKSQECWDDECDHALDADGRCAAPGRVARCGVAVVRRCMCPVVQPCVGDVRIVQGVAGRQGVADRS